MAEIHHGFIGTAVLDRRGIAAARAQRRELLFRSMITIDRMSTTRMLRRLAVLAFVASSSVLASACYMEADYPGYEDGYEPQFYNGYVVYYDDYGRPYYYVGEAVYWVPRDAPVYVGLVNHWRLYRVQYHAWYVHRGYGYRHYHGGFHGGGHHGGGHHGRH